MLHLVVGGEWRLTLVKPWSPQVWIAERWSGRHHNIGHSDAICWERLWTTREGLCRCDPPASEPAGTLRRPCQLRVAEEPVRPGSLPPEVMSRVPRLPCSSAGQQRDRAAARPRPAVPGRRSQQQPVCRVGGCVEGGAREGLRPDSDGGDWALCQKEGV